MIVIGIDPGFSSGGIALLGEPHIATFKLSAATEADIVRYVLGEHPPGETRVFAWIEKVHSMPGQGVSSSFKFGMSYGFLRGVLSGLRIPFEEVTPQKWQRAMNCMTRGDKNVSKARAQQLFPGVKITHANADALLIAEYGRRELVNRGIR